MILEAKGLKYSYGNNNLIDDIDFVIEDHDKIGLVGLNGVGKTTLLNIISKEHDPEKGVVNFIGKIKISYMHQEINIDEDITINEYINNSIDNSDIALHEAKAILTKLEITEFDKKICELSGGTKRKIVLGVTLAKPCDLLILDEPTNHLDSDIIEFLEKYLIKYNKAILMVTHDRYFLERVVNRIVELDKGKIYNYIANYSKYLELKNERAEYEEARNRKIQAFLRKEYEWIKRGPQARGTKDKKRIENYNELTSVKKEKDKTLVLESASSRLGNKTIEFINVSKEYDKLLFSGLSFNLNKHERIGIVGKNGSGKTTLLDLIAGVNVPTTGEISIGETIKIGYFKQENIDLDMNMKAIDYIKNIASYLNTDSGTISATSLLERFLFDDPYVYIGKLSGGEKRRLYLCGILMSNPNVLLFDEPTNDLDITTLSILEDYLEEFNGIVLVVSHDRYFLDKVVNRLFYLKDEKFTFLNGNYSDNIDTFKDTKASTQEIKPVNQVKQKKVKLSYNEQKEFDNILFVIDDIEKRIKELDELININYANYEITRVYLEEKKEKEGKLQELMERWEYLNNIYEESQK